MSNGEIESQGPSRREFLKTAAASTGGLVLGFYLPSGRGLEALAANLSGASQASTAPLVNAWLRIAPDETVTIFMAKAEMGQSVYTTLPSLVAEELGCDWSKVRVEFAPSDAEYSKFGPFTGGSSSVNGGFEALRSVGAGARAMLVEAAAGKLSVPASELTVENGVVLHKASGRRALFGELAPLASALKPPAKPTLKNAKDFVFIGKPLKRLDSNAKSTGRAEFAVDVRLPKMMAASVRLSPVFGGEVVNLAALRKKLPKGVRLEKIPNGVAAVAKNWWTAENALSKLAIQFSGGTNPKASSQSVSQQLREAAAKATVAHTSGDVGRGLVAGAKMITAEYEVPYLAHATMEPMSCVASVNASGCEIWTGSQSPFFNKMTLSKVLGLPQDKIRIHVTFLGGGFGRRAEQDFVVQAAVLAKAVGHPVKVIWPREQDMQHDYYRPAFYAKMEGALSASGEPIAWRAVNAGSSIITRWFPDKIPPNGHDFTSIEGFAKLPYAFPNQDIRSGLAPTVAPVGFWRSVGSSQNAFFVESFIDELASAAGRDGYEFRRSLLAKEPRHLAVLEAAAKKAGWRSFKSGAGRGMGIALAESFGTIVAEVAEVEVTRVDGADRVRVKRVVCAYDCGPIVNPSVIEAQMESAIIFGMTAALRGEITLKDGRVEQTSFDSYPLVTLAESPTIEVVRVASEAPMGGIGEPGTPPIAPAIANAIFAATGKRLRRLPLEKSLTSFAT